MAKIDPKMASLPPRYQDIKRCNFIACEFNYNELDANFRDYMEEVANDAADQAFKASAKFYIPNVRTLCGL